MRAWFSRRNCLLSGVVIFGVTTSALAQEQVELAPVVVQGQAGQGEAAAQPQQDKTATKISKAVLQERAAEDFDDIGRRVDAGVNFNTTSRSVNLRGLQDNRVLTTVDGVRVPWLSDPRDMAKGGLNAFDFDSLSSLDIVRGADSSRYGSGALGGVLLLRTLDPEDLIEDGKSFGGIVKGGYDSADESWRTNAALAARMNDTWMLVQGGYRGGHETDNFGNVGGFGAARTEPDPRDFDQKNMLVKLHQYVEGGHRFGLTGETSNRDDDIANMSGTTASYVPGSFFSGEEVTRNRISGDYQFESPDKSDIVDAARLSLYWTDQKLDATTNAVRAVDARRFIIRGDPFLYGYPSGDYQRESWVKQSNTGFSGDAEKELSLGGLSHTFRFGGEFYSQKTTQYSSGEDNCPDVDWSRVRQPFGPQTCRFLHTNSADMPEVDSLVAGFFIEDDIRLFDDRLTVTPGLRFDWFDHSPESTEEFERSPSYDADYLVENDDFGLSPKLRMAWQASPDVELFAQWSQGFRMASAQELYQNFANAGQYARLGNPALESETSNGFEFGAAWTTDDYGASLNVFNNSYRNFIDEVTLAPTAEYPLGIFTYRNIARAQIYGAEARGYARFADNWRTWASLAWAEGYDRDTRERISSVAPFRAILGLGYEQENWGADVSATFAARDQIDKASGANEFFASGYGLVDVTAWWSPAQVKGLKVQAGVYNVFDKKYWSALDIPENRPLIEMDRYTQAGRSFRLTLTQTF